MEDMKERLTKIFNGLSDIEVRGNGVMILSQIMFEMSQIINELDEADKEKAKEDK